MGVIVGLVIDLVMIFVVFALINVFEKTGKAGEEKNLTASEIVQCALRLYQQKKAEGMQFNSQCLGTCGNFAVDIVHVPRNEEDNKEENQCKEYREGKVNKFIELDKDGNIFRIA